MSKKIQSPLIVCILALICCALWGSAYPCIKIGYQLFAIAGTGSQILFAGYRFFLAGLLTLVIGCILERRLLKMQKSSILAVLRQGLLQTTLQYVCFYIGLAHTAAAKSSIISGANGFFSIIAAHFMMKSEKMTWKNGIGCLLGLSGVVVINIAPGSWDINFHLLGEGMVLLAAIAYGISTVTLKMISDRESAFTITAYQLLFGGAVLIVVGWLMGGTVTVPSASALGLLFYLALATTIAFSLWTILIKYNSIGSVAVYSFTIPIFGVLLSGLILRENVLSVKNLLALLMVSAGILVVNRKMPSRDKSP